MLEVLFIIVSLILGIMAQVDVGSARRAGRRLDRYLDNVTYFDPFDSLATSTFDLCHEPGAPFCTNVGRYSSDLLINSSINDYTAVCGPVVWAPSSEDDCCLNAPAELKLLQDLIDMAYSLMVVLTIGIIVGLCDLIFTFRPLPHAPSMACLCGTLWFDFAANIFLMIVLFPALLLETSFGRAGFDEPQCIARDRPELRDLMMDLETALISALEGSLTEVIYFSCAQLMFAAFLFCGTAPMDIFMDDSKVDYVTETAIAPAPSQHASTDAPFAQPPPGFAAPGAVAHAVTFVQPGGPLSPPPPPGYAPNSAADHYALQTGFSA